MDYDDNDFQSQSFQLGEENNISPSLRSFTLPKYDFDENLQAHLGFNGLDDTEDLLGIQTQQHSHWIEDFSRGSSRIEFDSGATESCCISRHSNVWSEAASSESVEMLLKSVGQDEGIVKETVTEELVSCDGFNSMNVQMVCNMNKDKDLPFVDKGPALPPDKTVTQLLSSGAGSEDQTSPTSRGEDSVSMNIIGRESTAGKKNPIGSLDADIIEDSTDVDQHLGANGAASGSVGEVVALESKMISVEGYDEREKVISSKNEEIGAGLCISSVKKNELMEIEVEPLSLEGETNIETDPTNDEIEDHISEKPFLQDNVQKGESEVSSSVRAEVQAEDGHKSSISSSAVKVYSPADLIRVPEETRMTIEDYGNLETGAVEISCRGPLHLIVSDKASESDIKNVVAEVPENVIQAQHRCIVLQGDEKKSAHSDDTRNGTSSNVFDSVAVTETLTDEQNISTTSEEKQGLLHCIIVEGQTSSGVVSEDTSEMMALDKLGLSNIPLRKSEVMNSAVEGKPGLPCSSAVETVFFGKEKEPVSDVFSEPSLLPSLKVDSSTSEVGNTVDTPSEPVPQHASLAAESINGNCKDESQACITLEKLGEERTNSPVFRACDRQEKDGLDVLPPKFEAEERCGEETGNTDVVESPHTAVVESPHAFVLDMQKVSEHTSNPEIRVESHKQGDRDSNPGNILVENVSEPTAEEGGGASEFGEQKCGSPTVISSQEQFPREMDSQDCNKLPREQNSSLLGDSDLVMSATGKSFDNVDLTANDAIKDEKSFTFEVSSLEVSDKESSQGLKPHSGAHQFGSSQACEGCPKESTICQSDDDVAQAVNKNNKKSSELEVDSGLVKDISDDKVMLVSSSGTPKRKSTKGRAPKETSSRKRKPENNLNLSSPSSSSAGNALQSVSLAGAKQYPYTEGNGAKSTSVSTYQASNLPDLNSSDSPTLLHQPFTDLQQVQLRAQIFVYGSLIQGTAPDEGCMVSAFGDRSQDGGRNMWEATWRLAVENFYSQQSPISNLESPLYTPSGGRTAQDKPLSSETANKSGMFMSVTSPAVHPSSPMWNAISQPQDVVQCSSMPRSSLMDAYQSLSPLFSYQFPQMHYRGNAALWPSQASVTGSPWMLPPQKTILDAGQQYTALSIAEVVQATPGRELSTASIVQLGPTTSLASTAGPVNLPASPSTAKDGKRKSQMSSSKIVSADQKSRKRRKSSSLEDLVQITPVNQTQKESIPVADSLTRCVSSAAGIPLNFTPVSSRVASNNFLVASPVSSAHFQVVPAAVDAQQKSIYVEGTHNSIEQANLQAKDAASHASSAVKHCQDIWSQLSFQKYPDLVSDVESKLASAAVAAAAGASVAMAAALAAKVASEAAMQAKLMIEEALKCGITDSASSRTGFMAPSPNLKGNDKATIYNSIITATRDTAQKRIEATSAAAKRAENLDAIVKAAELALEAVAQAGTIVAMGDPVPLKLNELLESGIYGHWKLHLVPAERKAVPNKMCRKDDYSEMNDAQEAADGKNQHVSGEMASGELVNGRHLISLGEKGLGVPEGQKQSYPGETIGSITESDVGSQSQNVDSSGNEYTVATKDCSIAKGSLVEVVPNEDGFRGVWHLAKVLVVENEKAYVCYDELLQDEGSYHLKEWVPLKGEGDEPPKIRIAHPVNPGMKYRGTRKRQRAAIGNYTWSIGDQVDVCMCSSWRTAVVIQRDKEDDTKLTVQFQGEKDLSVVRAWDLRAALLWQDGRWVEWSRQNNYRHSEGDTPLEKRQKLVRLGVGTESLAEGETNWPKEQVVKSLGKFEGSGAQKLSEKDKMFTMGKSIGEHPNTNAIKMKRTGLQKEGSKVIFGIPKPEKRRKFLEVSKHYVGDKLAPKNNEVADSTKLAKYLMPQGSTSSWKNAPKVDFRGKQPSDPKPRVLRSRKLQTTQRNPIAETEISSGSAGQISLHNGKRSVSHEENGNRNQNLLEVGSSSDGFKTSQDAGSALSSDALSSKKITTVEASKGTKEKLGVGGKVPQGQEKGSRLNDCPANPSIDPVEPRRSNRRMQPTSRLLEGLQSSSLNVAKLPPVPHARGPVWR